MEEKEIMLTPSANKDGMTSLEIAEVTGKQHSHIMRDVRTMVDGLKAQSTSGFTEDYHRGDRTQYKYLSKKTQDYLLDFCLGHNRLKYQIEETFYTDTQGRKQSMYFLNKAACYLLASGYNVLLRAKIIDRLFELESKERQYKPLSAYPMLTTERKKAEELMSNTSMEVLEDASLLIENHILRRKLQEAGIEYKERIF